MKKIFRRERNKGGKKGNTENTEIMERFVHRQENAVRCGNFLARRGFNQSHPPPPHTHFPSSLNEFGATLINQRGGAQLICSFHVFHFVHKPCAFFPRHVCNSDLTPNRSHFWDVAPRSLVITDRSLRGDNCLHHQTTSQKILTHLHTHRRENPKSHPYFLFSRNFKRLNNLFREIYFPVSCIWFQCVILQNKL
jgi:hypothetical protein